MSCHLDAINIYYENIVAALHCAASTALRKVPCHSLKPFWNEELDRLKQDSVFWHNMWSMLVGPLLVFCSILGYHDCKAKYKLAIWNAYLSYEDTISDEMCSHFRNKRIPEFGKHEMQNLGRVLVRKLALMGM